VHVQRLTTNSAGTHGQSGQTSVELAVITGLIAVVLIGVALALASSLGDTYQAVTDVITGLI
jgi:Flp pilus assembly pilin Flp